MLITLHDLTENRKRMAEEMISDVRLYRWRQSHEAYIVNDIAKDKEKTDKLKYHLARMSAPKSRRSCARRILKQQKARLEKRVKQNEGRIEKKQKLIDYHYKKVHVLCARIFKHAEEIAKIDRMIKNKNYDDQQTVDASVEESN